MGLPPDIPKVRWLPDPFYSEEGFRLGYLFKFESQLLWHFEGKLNLGSGSSPMTILDRDCVSGETARAAAAKNPNRKKIITADISKRCLIDQNPWDFSAVDPKLFQEYNNYPAAPVVVYYTHSLDTAIGAFSNFFPPAVFAKTDNYVHNIWPVSPEVQIPDHFSSERRDVPVAKEISPASGSLEGRVVKATMDHLFFKTYEILFQEGFAGSNFTRLSVNDSAMFDYLVSTMFTGKVIRIGYVRLFAIEGSFFSLVRGYSTNYRVVSADISPNQPPMEGIAK